MTTEKFGTPPESTAAAPNELAPKEQKLTELRTEQVQQIKDRLQALGEPQLQALPYSAENPLLDNCPLMTNTGYFEVAVDPRALQALGEVCQMTPELMQKVQVAFRAASLANRDFYGRAIGGYSVDDTVELYTSLPHTANKPVSAEQFHSITQHHLPFKEDQVLESFLHELRHQIQQKLGLFSGDMGSFMSTEHDDEAYEVDAIEFSQELVAVMQPYFHVRPYTTMEMYADGTQVETIQNLGAMKKYVTTETIVTTMSDYPKGMRLSDAIDTAVDTGLAALDDEKAALLIKSIDEALDAQEIGFSEWRFLLKQLHTEAQAQGNFDLMYLIEADFNRLGDTSLS